MAVPLFYPDGRKLSYKPDAIIGIGNEAVVVDVGREQVVKIYKRPDDPDFQGLPAEQAGAEARLLEHNKKLPAFPKGLPSEAVVPIEILRTANNEVGAYSMKFIKGTQILMKYYEPQFRAGVPFATIKKAILGLYDAMLGIHKAQVVIGDFNDRNILVSGSGEIWLVDVDSWQYGQWLCRLFTAKFIDPRLSSKNELMLQKAHDTQSDGYAFAQMLYELLTLHGIYDSGKHTPSDVKKRVRGITQRTLNRIPAWDSEVQLPTFVHAPLVLPDELMSYLDKMVSKDDRSLMPRKLLENLEERTCDQTGKIHYRNRSPFVAGAPAAASVEKTTVTGKLTVIRQFLTSGWIVFASCEQGNLRYLYHENGWYYREGGKRILQGKLDPELRYRIIGNRTLFAKGNKMTIYEPNGLYRGLITDMYQGETSVVAANSRHYYWTLGDKVYRDDHTMYGIKDREALGGPVFSRQTLIWTGEKFGFGFYRIGNGTQAFIFDAERPDKFKEMSKSPKIRGQLLDVSCTFSDQFCWLTVTTQEGSETYNRCFVISADGNLITDPEHATQQGEDDWLADTIRGYAAIKSTLFVPHSEGLMTVEFDGSTINVNVFPDTQKYVDARTHLFIGASGIYSVTRSAVHLLQMK